MNIPQNHCESWQRKSQLKGFQMFFADVAGNAVDLLFLRYQTQIDRALPFLKTGFKTVMYTPFRILQSPLEFIINKMGSNIEGKEARAKRMNQNEEQRLDGLLDSGYHYLAASAVGFATLIAAEKGASKLMSTGHVPNKVWWRIDLPVHLGMAAILCTKAANPVTNVMKGTMKKIMVKSGWTEEKAEMDSRFVLAYILPNYLTLIPTTLGMSSMYYAAEKGVLHDATKELTHSFHALPGKTAADLAESNITRTMVSILQKLGAIEAHRK